MFSKFFGTPDLSLTVEEVELRRKKQKRLITGIVALLVLLGVAVLSARPVVHQIHGWQARRHAAKAFDLIDREQWGPARDEATAAYRLRSTEPQAIRAIARLFSRAGHPDALKFWRELGAVTKLTRADLRDEAGLALKLRELTIADEAITELLNTKQGGPEPVDWLLAAQLETQKQNLDGAVIYLRKIFESSSSSDREKFQATIVLDQIADAKQDAERRDVIDRLSKFAQGSNDVALDALVSLGQRILAGKITAASTALSLEQIIEGLERNASSKPQHKLLAVDLKMQQRPSDHDALVQSATDEFKNGDNAALIVLATWLNGHGEYQRELDTISRERALQTRELFFQHVDALGALGRWDEIRRLIETEKFPLDPVVEHMYLARCFAQLGQSNGAENNWRRALEAAAGDPAKLITLAEYAEKNDALDTAAAAFEASIAVVPRSRQAQQGRLRIALNQRDTKNIHRILAELLILWPNDPAVQNDEAYTRLLLLPEDKTDELNAIVDLAESLVKKTPSSLPHRTLLALALLKQHRAGDALAVYKDINLAPGALTASALAVHAAVLARAGHAEDARTELNRLPVDGLLPEERALAERP